MNTTVELTTEESREFTALNAAAFDLYRQECATANTHPCCWLTMSEESRDDARKRIAEELYRRGALFVPSVDGARVLLDGMTDRLRVHIDAWRNAETQRKSEREAGNPKAFFV